LIFTARTLISTAVTPFDLERNSDQVEGGSTSPTTTAVPMIQGSYANEKSANLYAHASSAGGSVPGHSNDASLVSPETNLGSSMLRPHYLSGDTLSVNGSTSSGNYPSLAPFDSRDFPPSYHQSVQISNPTSGPNFLSPNSGI